MNGTPQQSLISPMVRLLKSDEIKTEGFSQPQDKQSKIAEPTLRDLVQFHNPKEASFKQQHKNILVKVPKSTLKTKLKECFTTNHNNLQVNDSSNISRLVESRDDSVERATRHRTHVITKFQKSSGIQSRAASIDALRLPSLDLQQVNLHSIVDTCKEIRKKRGSIRAHRSINTLGPSHKRSNSNPYLGYDLQGKSLDFKFPQKEVESPQTPSKKLDREQKEDHQEYSSVLNAAPKGSVFEGQLNKKNFRLSSVNKSNSSNDLGLISHRDKDSKETIFKKWKKIEDDLQRRTYQKELFQNQGLKSRFSKFLVQEASNSTSQSSAVKQSSRRRSMIVGQDTESHEKIPEVLKTFWEFSMKHSENKYPAVKNRLIQGLKDYFRSEIHSFLDSFKILRDYDIETAFLEQILSSYVHRFVAKEFHEYFRDAIVKDNKLKEFPEPLFAQKIDSLLKAYMRLPDSGRQWAFLKTFKMFKEMASIIVYEIKTRHYDKLKTDVVFEFGKYKKKHYEFMVTRHKFTIFRQDLKENHEMLKAARKFHTSKGTFNILDFQEQMKNEGFNIGDPSSKTFLLNRHIEKIISEFARLE